jgi:hypothetical protein
MKDANWKLVGYISLGLGVLFLAVGIGAVLISRQGDYIPLSGDQYETVYPYQVFGIGLLIVGGALLVFGAAFIWRGTNFFAPTTETVKPTNKVQTSQT